MCEMKYSLIYNFGFKDKQNKKATLGTIVHRALQVLGDASIAKRNGKRKVINDDIPSYTLKQCDDTDTVTKHCFDYYVEQYPELEFDAADLRLCQRWVKKAIAHDDNKLDPRNQHVVITEKFFEIELDKPWAKYAHVVGDKVIEGNLILRGTIDLIIKEDEDYYQVLDYKGLPVETPIPTPTGWSTMGDLVVGDCVFDRFGKQTKVVAKSKQKMKECYQIEFDDTSKVICDDEHKWKLIDGTTVEIKNLKVSDNISVAGPLECEEPVKSIILSKATYQPDKGFRQIVKIEKIGKKLTQCITVDSADSTYLCTESMIPTHNSGKRLNWATGKEKTYECFHKDFQLLLYYYVMRTLHPDHRFYVSIFYINDGGVYDIVFDDYDYQRAEDMIRQKFEYIKTVKIPQQISSDNSHWKCQKLCKFSEPHESGKTICQFMRSEIVSLGYEDALAKHGNLRKINKYSDGGGRIADD